MYGSQAENTMTFVLMHDLLTIQATESLMIFALSRQTSVFIIFYYFMKELFWHRTL